MPRNFDRRIEIAYPVIEPRLQTKLKEILELQLTDNVKGWWMQPDGSYVRIKDGDKAAFRFQERFYEMLQEERSSSASGIGRSDWHNCQADDFPYAFAAADSD
jgi:polyphosphate kinase